MATESAQPLRKQSSRGVCHGSVAITDRPGPPDCHYCRAQFDDVGSLHLNPSIFGIVLICTYMLEKEMVGAVIGLH